MALCCRMYMSLQSKMKQTCAFFSTCFFIKHQASVKHHRREASLGHHGELGNFGTTAFAEGAAALGGGGGGGRQVGMLFGGAGGDVAHQPGSKSG